MKICDRSPDCLDSSSPSNLLMMSISIILHYSPTACLHTIAETTVKGSFWGSPPPCSLWVKVGQDRPP
jgi:hypothetical protein